jgi:WD40 repeat protein
MIAFSCFGCGQKLRARDPLAGGKAKCPRCGVFVPIPSAPAEASARTPRGPSKEPQRGRPVPAPAKERDENVTLPPPSEPASEDAALETLKPKVIRGGTEGEHETSPLGPSTHDAGAAKSMRVPGYEILAELGRGGMGVVYQARHVTLGRLVALKMLLAGSHAGEQDLARFRTEAAAVARLQHPNIVQIYEIGEAEGKPFFALEFLEGGSLSDQLDGTPLPPRQAAQLVKTLAKAMQAAHEQGIVHRDLKPGNVLLTADGTPKITDFGLAKRLDDTTGQTASGAILGTPSYMAPEQAGGKSKTIGPAADVYALGAILYELLTGRPPFKAAVALDTVLQVLSDEPVPPRRLEPKIPHDLETICLKCLAKEPPKRYATATDLADDLRSYLAGKPIQARPVSAPERAVKWIRQRPQVAALMGALLVAALALLVGGIWFTAQLRIERDQAEQAKQEAEAARGQAEAEKQEAVRARRRAETDKHHTEMARYAVQIRLAQRELQDQNIGRAEQVLHGCSRDLRGWEHRYLWTLSQRRMRTLRGHTNEVRSVCFSPDGKRLASAGDDHKVKVWDAVTGELTLTLERHRDVVRCVVFSPDGKGLASAGEDNVVRVWDATTGQQTVILEGHSGGVTSVAYSADGKRLVSGGRDATVRVWEAATGHEIVTLRGHTDPVWSVAFSPDGKRLASASADKSVRVWDLPKGENPLILQGHTGTVNSVGFSPNGQRLASASDDATVLIWDLTTGRSALSLTGHTEAVKSIAFSTDGRLASASADSTVRLWGPYTGRSTHILKGHTLPVTSVAFSPDGQRLATASRDQTVRLWDLAPDAVALKGNAAILAVGFSPDGQRLASASADTTVRVWDGRTAQQVLSLKGHQSAVTSVAFSPDRQRLASGSQDGTVKVWDPTSGEAGRTLQGHTGGITSLAFSPAGQRLASASRDGTVRVWDMDTGELAHCLKGHTDTVNCVAFSPDGRYLASGSDDRTVKVWDAQSGEAVFSAESNALVYSVAFSPDGKRLASAWGDGIVRVWDTFTGKNLITLSGHTLSVTSVAFNPDGHRLASASKDGTVRIWDMATGQETLSLEGHTGAVNSVAFSPDGRRLASASDDGTVRIWDATSAEEEPGAGAEKAKP